MPAFHSGLGPDTIPLFQAQRVDANSIDFRVAAWGCVRYSLAEIEQLRKKPPGDFPAVVTPAFFKHSDEQTIASVGALVRAIRDFEMPLDQFQSWSIAAAPRFMGRTALAAGMHRYETDGPWGTSVQTVPHRSQHSVASTLSLVLGARGPCIGAGSGHGSDVEVLLTSLSLLNDKHSAGTWVVMSGFDPELKIDRAGKPITDSACAAVAIALTSTSQPSFGELRLRFVSSQQKSDEQAQGPLAALSGIIPQNGGMPLPEVSVQGNSKLGLDWELHLRNPQSSLAAVLS